MQDHNLTTCIILAGGLGTRLNPILKKKPKCLANINEKSFLEILLISLSSRGFKKFILALGYGHDQVLEEIKKNWAKGLEIKYSIEEKKLGTGGAIKNALNLVNTDECLVLNGDTLIAGDINIMKRKLDLKNSERIRMALIKVSNRTRYGGVNLDKNSFITSFNEKGFKEEGLINSGLYRIKKDIFKDIPNQVFSFEEFLSNQISINKFIKGEIVKGPFIDIGIPEDLEYLCKNEKNYV